MDWGTARTFPEGRVIRLGTPERGLRSYLAVRGGITVAPVLGSRSRDGLGDLGPPPLRPGDVLPIGPPPGRQTLQSADGAVMATVSRTWPTGPMAVIPGPRDDWFDATALDLLVRTPWRVRPDSDRIGLRLDGPALPRIRTEELPSEPTLPGAIQVAADGRPILFGPDAPVTGGYPVIAVVRSGELDVAAQLRPGDVAQFQIAR
jgi:biotin-dependent carboxylase-like uncharacterized protein